RPSNNFKFLRWKPLVAKGGGSQNVRDFIRAHPLEKHHDPKIAEQLLATSINPFDSSTLEPALYFWLHDSNIKVDYARMAIASLSKHHTLSKNAKAAIGEAFD